MRFSVYDVHNTDEKIAIGGGRISTAAAIFILYDYSTGTLVNEKSMQISNSALTYAVEFIDVVAI